MGDIRNGQGLNVLLRFFFFFSLNLESRIRFVLFINHCFQYLCLFGWLQHGTQCHLCKLNLSWQILSLFPQLWYWHLSLGGKWPTEILIGQVDQPDLGLPLSMYLDLDSYADYIAAYKTYMVDTARVMVRELGTAVPDEQLAMVSPNFLQQFQLPKLPNFLLLLSSQFKLPSTAEFRAKSWKTPTGRRQDLWLWDERGFEDVPGLWQAQLHGHVQPHDHRWAQGAYAKHGLGQVRSFMTANKLESFFLELSCLFVHARFCPI